MHIKALAAVLGLSLAACTGVIDDGGVGGGGDDEPGGQSCGDGSIQAGEACDDGNQASGDGCSASCSTEQQLMPRVTATLDKVTVNTELGKTEKLTINFSSVDGFTGPVNLAAIADYGTATGNWTITPSKPAATLTAGGTDSITVDVVIPSDASALTGTIKLDATSTVTPVSLTSTVNVTNKYTVVIPAGTGVATPHGYTGSAPVIRLRQGAQIVFDNQDTRQHAIHGSGGIEHQDTGAGQPGTQYIQTPSGSATWYCHTHNEDGARSYNIQLVQ